MTTSCAPDSRYFGKTTPPSSQHLLFLNGPDPGSLDPAKEITNAGYNVIRALFDGLTRNHPKTLEPMAGLATHYETNPAGTQLTFYLRGHPHPRGSSFPNTDSLRQEYEAGLFSEDFSHGVKAPPDNLPARWSDGRPITAQDFVYAWRRAVEPATGGVLGNYFWHLRYGEEVSSGKRNPRELGVYAPDDFTVRVDLRRPTPFFLRMLAIPVFAALPRHSLEPATTRGMESSWWSPGTIVTSGPFMLHDVRPYDWIVLEKNPGYWQADLVQIERIDFLPIADGVTNMNVYKAGEAHAMDPSLVPQPFLSPLSSRKDFHLSPSLNVAYLAFNVARPPFDNLLLRYALNMAVDKKMISSFLGATRSAAAGYVPPIDTYPAPKTLPVTLGGETFNVLSYNPDAARRLLAKAGFPGGIGPDGRRIKFSVLFPMAPKWREVCEILQQQWGAVLNLDVNLVAQEYKVYVQSLFSRNFDVSGTIFTPDYVDPEGFLSAFETANLNNTPGWADRIYDRMLAEANTIRDSAERMKKLAECESYLLKAMPVAPMYVDVWTYPRKPFLHGLEPDRLDGHAFQYAWIDTNWKHTN